MSKSFLNSLKKMFQAHSQSHFSTKYLWDYEYGNPEKEFLQALQEFRSKNSKLAESTKSKVNV